MNLTTDGKETLKPKHVADYNKLVVAYKAAARQASYWRAYTMALMTIDPNINTTKEILKRLEIDGLTISNSLMNKLKAAKIIFIGELNEKTEEDLKQLGISESEDLEEIKVAIGEIREIMNRVEYAQSQLTRRN